MPEFPRGSSAEVAAQIPPHLRQPTPKKGWRLPHWRTRLTRSARAARGPASPLGWLVKNLPIRA